MATAGVFERSGVDVRRLKTSHFKYLFLCFVEEISDSEIPRRLSWGDTILFFRVFFSPPSIFTSILRWIFCSLEVIRDAPKTFNVSHTVVQRVRQICVCSPTTNCQQLLFPSLKNINKKK